MHSVLCIIYVRKYFKQNIRFCWSRGQHRQEACSCTHIILKTSESRTFWIYMHMRLCFRRKHLVLQGHQCQCSVERGETLLVRLYWWVDFINPIWKECEANKPPRRSPRIMWPRTERMRYSQCRSTSRGIIAPIVPFSICWSRRKKEVPHPGS